MADPALTISDLAIEGAAPAPKDLWMAVQADGSGHRYLRRPFPEAGKPRQKARYALVVAASEDDARHWAHGCSSVENVNAEQVNYRVMASAPQCVGALLVTREHDRWLFRWLTKDDDL